MQQTHAKIAISGVITLIAAVCTLLFMPFYQSHALTERYGTEMAQSLHRYVMTKASIAGKTDPHVIATIATGEYLDYLLKYRCRSCESVYVATKADIVNLKVLEYSPDRAKVLARIEYGWRWVSLDTGEPESPCIAQAYTEILILEKHEGVWKVAGGESTDRDPVDNSPELLEKYCTS